MIKGFLVVVASFLCALALAIVVLFYYWGAAERESQQLCENVNMGMAKPDVLAHIQTFKEQDSWSEWNDVVESKRTSDKYSVYFSSGMALAACEITFESGRVSDKKVWID